MRAIPGWRTLKLCLIHVGAALAGYAVSRTGMPMPWLIGPMVFTTLYGLWDRQLRLPKFTRPVGQIIVAGVVGISFTPSAFAALSDHILAMLLVSLGTILAGFSAAVVLRKLSNIDVISACIASIPGGPVEMSSLAERYGVPPAPIAFVQTLRIALLVLTVPALMMAVSGGVRDPSLALGGGQPDYPGGLLLMAIAAIGGLIFFKLRLTSPFFLGALGFSAISSVLLLPVAMPPYWLLNTAQVLLGVWLGNMFDRSIFVEMRSFVLAAGLSTAVLLLLSVAVALGVSALADIQWETMILATAPGSVTEMALTARFMHQGVALVTAFHIVRIFTIMPLAPLIFTTTIRVTRHFEQRRQNPARG